MILVIIIILAILFFLQLNLPLMQECGACFDITAMQNWGNIAYTKNITSLYLELNGGDPLVYPPIYIYALEFNAWLHDMLFENLEPGKYSYNFVHKTIPLLSSLIVALGLFLYLRRTKYKFAYFAMLAYLFNLAVIYNVAYWGQIDSVAGLFMFFSVLFLLNKKYLLSTIVITLGIFTKIQSIILVPIILVVLLKQAKIRDLIKITIVNTLVVLTILWQFLIIGSLKKALIAMTRSYGWFSFVTVNAYNLWYLFFPQKDWYGEMPDTAIYFGVSLRTIGRLMFLVYVLLVMYQLYKKTDEEQIVLAASSVAFAFFILPTQIHERYLFFFFPLFAIIALKKVRYAVIYTSLAIVHLLNLMMVSHFSGPIDSIFYPIQIFLDGLVEQFSFTKVAWVIAFIHVILFVYFSHIGIFRGISKNVQQDLSRLKRNRTWKLLATK